MILADTSAWAEYDRATGSSVDLRLAELISTDGPLTVSEPVVMEVLAGARTQARQNDLRRLLSGVRLLPFDAVVDFDAAARIYRRCRAAGVTPRGMIDCMIAAVALRREASLLSCDIDLYRVATVVEIHLDDASLRG
ncbi:MAG: PIN domain nuclease [Actinomycetota bacterium]|nr:PIN domain nuclease [Actinomycetota bacterium]